MAKREWVDPGRRRILQRQAEDGSRRWTIDPESLRVILVEATAELGSPELYADRLGCTPGFLRAVLAGRRRPGGAMLDVLGLEYLPALAAYADPLDSARARLIQHDRIIRSVPKATRESALADPQVQGARRRLLALAKREAEEGDWG